MSDSSSDQVDTFSLFTGATTPNPDIVGSFRVGDNDLGSSGLPEFSLSSASADAATVADGHLTWDPAYKAKSPAAFSSVAAVRLDITSDGCRFAVGTSNFITLHARPFKSIRLVQVLARAGRNVLARLLQWDTLEITFVGADGRGRTCVSHSLPRATDSSASRRSVAAPPAPPSSLIQQFAEIRPGPDVTEMHLRGQVTLRANHSGPGTPLEADDLYGAVLVFTDAAAKATA